MRRKPSSTKLRNVDNFYYTDKINPNQIKQLLIFRYYTRKIVIVMTKGKKKKMKTAKIYLFLMPPLPSQHGGGGGVANIETYRRIKIHNLFFGF